MKNIPYGRQSVDRRDIRAVTGVLKGDWLTQGPGIEAFEQALCRYTGARYAVAVSNGTAALHLALLAMGIGKGDEVVTCPITFAASANCALYVGARPRMVDIDPQTCHLDAGRLRDFLKAASRRRRVKAVIPVDFTGTVVDMPAVRKVCARYGIRVVRDACHALGAAYEHRGKWLRVGDCRHSDVTVFSFHPIKNITTGEGGAIMTNDQRIYRLARRYRHHGIVRELSDRSSPLKKYCREPWFYDIPQVGHNFRITDMQCALGLSQLKKIEGFIKKRRGLVARYNRAFQDLGDAATPYERPRTRGAYHLYVLRVKDGRRNGLCRFLRERGISTQVNYIPVHLLTYYRKALGYRRGDFPEAEKYFGECLSLPLFPGLARPQQDRVIRSTLEFFHG